MAPKVLIIGAQGVLGSAFVRCFSGRGWTVLRGGRRPETGPGFRFVDLDRPETVREAMSGVDLVIDLVPHPGLVPERMVLREGGTLIDVSARPDADCRALRAEASAARGLVILNAGRTPGISSLVAADLLAAHPDADEIEIAMNFSAAGMSGRSGGEFAHRHLTARRRHRTGSVAFPKPIGSQRCLEFAESDRGWLGDLADERKVSTYVRFGPRALNRTFVALNGFGLMKALPRSIFRGASEAPTEPTLEPVTEWVAVRSGNGLLAASTIEGRGAYLMTAAATAVIADAVLDKTPPARFGCAVPHELFTLEQLEPELRRAGLRIIRRSGSSTRSSSTAQVC